MNNRGRALLVAIFLICLAVVAYTYMFQFKAQDVIKTLKSYIQQVRDPILGSRGFPLHSQGRKLVMENNYVEGVKYLNQALERDPKLGISHLMLGVAYMNTSQIERAAKEFEIALSDGMKMYDADRAAAHYNLSIIAPNPAKAIEHLKKAIDIDSSYLKKQGQDPYLLLAAAYMADRKPDEAKKVLEEALLKDQDNFDYLMMLGQIASAQADFIYMKENVCSRLSNFPDLEKKKIGRAVVSFCKSEKLEKYYTMAKEGRQEEILQELTQRKPKLSPQEMIDPKLLEAVKKDPNSFEANWNIAGGYLSGGFGPEAVEHLKRCLEIDEKKATEGGVIYMMLAMAHNYAGEYKKSMEMVQKAIELDPNNEIAKNFKSMLETVAKRDFGGELPEKVSMYGYRSAGEMGRAMLENGTGVLGEKEDSIMFDFAQIYLTPPEGWQKKANVPHSTGVSYLMYAKEDDKPLPAIGVTRDFAAPEMKTALDFTKKIKTIMQQSMPMMIVAEPQATVIAGQDASIFDMHDDQNWSRSYWYQFLIDGNIISLQLMTEVNRFDQDFADFKKFAESLRIEKSVRAQKPEDTKSP